MSPQHSRFRVTPGRLWLSIFGLWTLLLTGVFNTWFGSPGLVQWARLSLLLSKRQDKIAEVENQIVALSAEQVRLEKSSATQQREIRRVLGYVRQDELVFDFSAEIPRPGPDSPAVAAFNKK